MILNSDFYHLRNHSNLYYLFVANFLMETGLRPSELFCISKSHLLLRDGIFNFKQPKTGIYRTITISQSTLNSYRYWHNLRGNFSTNFRNYNQLKTEICNNIVFHYIPPTGHKKLYYFRYLFVLGLIEEGLIPSEISALIGHNDLSTVNSYIKIAKSIFALAQTQGE